jgi:hypothetical protein
LKRTPTYNGAEAKVGPNTVDPMPTGAPPPRTGPLWPFILIAVLAITAVHVGVFFRDGLAGDRMLQDTDAYMWMNRVVHLHGSGDWFDHVYPRVNPPEGHVQHWTRPLDVLLLGGGVLAGTVVGFERGLYYWAVVLPPLLHLAALFLLLWAVRPLVRRGLLPPAGMPTLLLVFVAQMAVYQPFLAGRPDHHAPLALLFVAYLGFLVRVLLEQRDVGRWAVGLGLVGALAIWVNVEAMVYVVLGLFGLGVAWLGGNVRLASVNAIHGMTLFAGVLTAWLVQWGPEATTIRAMDTLSMPHVGVFGLAAVFWTFLWWVSRTGLARNPTRRTGLAAAGATAVLAATYVVFPEFFGNPLHGVDGLYRETRLRYLDELQPLAASAGHARAGAGNLIVFAGPAFAALPYLALRLFRERKPGARVLWLAMALFVMVYTVLALEQRRWVDYLALSALIPYTVLAAATLRRLEARVDGRMLRMVRPLVLLAFVAGPIVAGNALGALGAGPVAPDSAGAPELRGWGSPATAPVVAPRTPGRARRTCDLARIAEVLRDPEWFPEPELVLSHTDHGPELLYRTHHHVLSIPNHRYQPGYRFMRDTMGHPDPEIAATALHERGVGIIVLCSSDLAPGFLHFPTVEKPFVRHLATGRIPHGYDLHAATPHWRIYRRVGP